MTRATFDTIIQPTVLLLRTENRFVVGVHSEMAKEWLDNRLHDIVQRALASVVGAPVEVSFELVVGN
jgi:chromosomal replication initiation ATPase DnaA